MLVRLVKLRHRGEKRPPADVREDPGEVGELLVTPEEAAFLRAEVLPSGKVLQRRATLSAPRVKITNSILVQGVETALANDSTVGLAEFAQSWWCRLLDAAPPGGALGQLGDGDAGRALEVGDEGAVALA